MKSSRKTTLYLPEELHAAVKIEAAKQRISMTKLVIQALEHELERLAEPAGKSDSMKGRNDQ